MLKEYIPMCDRSHRRESGYHPIDHDNSFYEDNSKSIEVVNLIK